MVEAVQRSARRLEEAALITATRASRLPRKLLPASWTNHTTTVPILCYHRTSSFIDGERSPNWNVSPQDLHQQLDVLLDRGWCPLPLQQVIEATHDGATVPHKNFVVTFDDGYHNNLSEALPVLEALSVPATLFVTTGAIDSQKRLPSDSWALAGSDTVPRDSWLPISESDCKTALDSPLLSLGCHTHFHVDYQGDVARFSEDLHLSKKFLEQHFGMCDIPFAFPYGMKHLGHVTEPLVDVVRQLGFTCALTLETSLASLRGNPFDWGRIVVDPHDTGDSLDLKMSETYVTLKQIFFKATYYVRPSVLSSAITRSP